MQQIRVLVLFRNEEPDRIVAHNLSHDLVCVAATPERAEQKILAATEEYIRWCSQDTTMVLDRPAPLEFWRPVLEWLRNPEVEFPVITPVGQAHLFGHEPNFALTSVATV